jgi:hypothetical protein
VTLGSLPSRGAQLIWQRIFLPRRFTASRSTCSYGRSPLRHV